MGSKNSEPWTTSKNPYRQLADRAAHDINTHYPRGLGHDQIATLVPGRKGKPPEVVYLHGNNEGKYAYDQNYYNQMEELLNNDGAGVWDRRQEGHRGSGNIDVRMREERARHGEEQREERGDGRAQGQEGEARVPAGLRGDMGRQRVYAPAGDGDRKVGGKRARGTVHVDKQRQAFVRRKRRTCQTHSSYSDGLQCRVRRIAADLNDASPEAVTVVLGKGLEIFGGGARWTYKSRMTTVEKRMGSKKMAHYATNK